MRSQRSILNFVTGLGQSTLSMVVALVAAPLILSWLGDQRYGAFRLLTDWWAQLQLLDLGLGAAMMPLMARAASRGDEGSVRSALAAGTRAYLYVTLAMAAAGAAIVVLAPWLVPVDAELVGELRLAATIMLAGVVLNLANPYRSLFIASQRSYFINAVLTVQGLLITGLSLALVAVGWGIPGQAAAILAGNVLFAVVVLNRGMRAYPAPWTLLRSPPSEEDREAGRSLWKLNTPSLILKINGQLNLSSDNIIIGLMLAPEAVAAFFLTQRLAVLATAQVQGISGACWASLVDLHNQGRAEDFRDRLLETAKLVAVVGASVMIPIAAYNRHFMALWVGADHDAGDVVSLLAGINGFLAPLITLAGWVYLGTGRAWRHVPRNIVTTVLNVGLSILFTYWYGLPGPLMGTLAARLAVTPWWLAIQLRADFAIPIRGQAVAVGLPMLLGLPVGVATWIHSHRLDDVGWLELAGLMSGTSLAYLALAWLLVLTRAERSAWAARLRPFWLALRRRLPGGPS